MGTQTKLSFSTSIDASKEKVWNALWQDENYRKWTSEFHPGSYAESDWKKGSKIQFLTPEKDGMYSSIHELVTNEKMVFRHIGEIKKGVEQQPAEWEGALESYTLKENNGTTNLDVEVDMAEEYGDYFRNVFPKALQVVKEIAEGI